MTEQGHKRERSRNVRGDCPVLPPSSSISLFTAATVQMLNCDNRASTRECYLRDGGREGGMERWRDLKTTRPSRLLHLCTNCLWYFLTVCTMCVCVSFASERGMNRSI